MKKEYEIINELLEQELLKDEKEVVETQPLKSNTQVCEEESYNYQPGKQMPQAFQCGGVANAGKYMRVAPDGYIRPMPGSGGGEGYEPDFTTIGLTSNSELAVMDYISYTTVNTLLGAKQDLITAQTDLDVRNISVNNRVWFGNYYIDEPSLSALLETVQETLPEAIAEKQDTLTAGTGISIVNNVISATGGGSGEPVYVISGRATITDPSDLTDIEIDITSPNYYSELRAFFDENGHLPRIVADIEIITGTTTLRTVELDMYANNVDSDKIDIQGSLVEETVSLSYIEFVIKSTEQEGHLSAIQLQERLTTDSAIRVREIHFPSRTIVDDNYLSNIAKKTEIVANPVDTATTSLSKIKLYDTVYSISGGSGTGSYNDLTDKPSINSVELSGNKTPAQLGMVGTGPTSQAIDGTKFFTNGAIAGNESTSYTVYGLNTISRHPVPSIPVGYTYTLPDKTGTVALTSDIVANPTDTGTTNLTKLKLFDTTYNLASQAHYYLHTVSFETLDDNMHWQVGIITQSPNQFTDIQDFWTKIEKIVSIFGTPTNLSTTKEIYFNGALAESGAIHTRGIDSNFEVKVKNIALTDVEWSSFAQFGIEEL